MCARKKRNIKISIWTIDLINVILLCRWPAMNPRVRLVKQRIHKLPACRWLLVRLTSVTHKLKRNISLSKKKKDIELLILPLEEPLSSCGVLDRTSWRIGYLRLTGRASRSLSRVYPPSALLPICQGWQCFSPNSVGLPQAALVAHGAHGYCLPRPRR